MREVLLLYIAVIVFTVWPRASEFDVLLTKKLLQFLIDKFSATISVESMDFRREV